MNGALLNIIDKVNGTETNFLYKFYKITTYYKLLKDLPKIYSNIDSNFQITFIYNDIKNSYVVTDLNTYILSGDRIDVKLKSDEPIYFLYDICSKNIIKKSYNISDLYQLYSEEIYDCEILIYKKKGSKVRLIDVLDSPTHHKNKCINRLVQKYNY